MTKHDIEHYQDWIEKLQNQLRESKELCSAILAAEQSRRERSRAITERWGEHHPLEMPPSEDEWLTIVEQASKLYLKI